MLTIEERLASLETRNAILERSQRRWRKVGLLGSVIAGLGLTMGQAASTKPGPLVASSLKIVDANGKSRVSIGVNLNNVGIVVLDEKGKERIAIGEGKNPTGGDGTGVTLFDAQGRPRLSIGVSEQGQGIVQLDENGKPVRP